MKNKIKKLSLGLLAPTLLAPVAVLASCNLGIDSLKNNNSNNLIDANGNIKYLFNGRYYDSLDDITNQLVNNNSYINSDLFYGNAKDAIFDHETNRLNINQLKKFDNSKISSAYLNAFGGHEQDFNKAKKSFVNEGLVKYKYQDTQGKLHSSFSEAKRAILDGVKVDEAVFYKVVDISDNNKEYKINPLNPDDINLMKKIAINSTKKNIDEKTPSEFGIKPMIKDANGDFNALTSTTSLLSQMFSQTIGGAYNGFYKKLITAYDSAIKEVMESTKFNANVKFNYESSKSPDLLKYDIKTLGGDLNVVPAYSDNRLSLLSFNDVSFEQLNDFDVFLDRTTWNKWLPSSTESKKSKVQLSTKTGYPFDNKIADTLTFTNFIKDSFQLFSTGYDGDWDVAGINTQILEKGTWNNSQLHFDVNFSIQEEGDFFVKLRRTILDNILPELSTNIANVNNEEQDIERALNKSLVDVFMDTNFKVKDEHGDETININKKNFENVIYNKYNKDINKNLREIKSLELVLSDMKNLISRQDNLLRTNSMPLLFDVYNNDNIDYFLTYNQVPIFKTKERIKLEPLTDSNYERAFYSLYLENSIFDTYNLNELNYDKFKNISNFVSEDGNKISNKALLINPEITDGYFTIPGSEYQGMLNDKFGDAPRGYSNNFYYALNSYNKNLKYLNKKYSNKLPSHINKKLIDGTNLLILRNENTSSVDNSKAILDTYYGEFISLTYDFNESLANNNTLIYDKVTLKSSIEANTRIDPAKVIVIYDLSGNIINPGIQISDDLIMQTTSDAMYDSERTILDNIYRTLIVKKDPNKIFYKNENDTYTLLDYQTNFIYQLEYNKKIHYFLTYHDAWLYLREIASLEAQKVNIKGERNESN